MGLWQVFIEEGGLPSAQTHYISISPSSFSVQSQILKAIT